MFDLAAEGVADLVASSTEAVEINPAPASLPVALWPLPNKTLLFIGQDNDNVDEYAEAFGSPPGFSVYVSIDDLDNGLWGPGDWGAGRCCADCYLKEYGKGVAFNLAINIVDMLDDVVAGAWDDNIMSLAAWVKSTGGPVYLRPGYEFDGQWNHFEPVTFRFAYQRFVDIFRNANVVNVLWVWHSAAFLPTYKGHDWMEWYPGDEYVDLFGASIFTGLYPEGHPYRGNFPQEMEMIEEWANVAAHRRKPLVIVESTPRGYNIEVNGSSAWESWFQPMFEFIEKHDVRLFAYINCNWDVQAMWDGQGWGDTRLQANDLLAASWTEEMSNDRWSNVFLPLG